MRPRSALNLQKKAQLASSLWRGEQGNCDLIEQPDPTNLSFLVTSLVFSCLCLWPKVKWLLRQDWISLSARPKYFLRWDRTAPTRCVWIIFLRLLFHSSFVESTGGPPLELRNYMRQDFNYWFCFLEKSSIWGENTTNLEEFVTPSSWFSYLMGFCYFWSGLTGFYQFSPVAYLQSQSILCLYLLHYRPIGFVNRPETHCRVLPFSIRYNFTKIPNTSMCLKLTKTRHTYFKTSTFSNIYFMNYSLRRLTTDTCKCNAPFHFPSPSKVDKLPFEIFLPQIIIQTNQLPEPGASLAIVHLRLV